MNKPLTGRLRLILLAGPKDLGSYKPDDALLRFQENMTGVEYKAAWDFLSWVHNNQKQYGTATLTKRWREWQNSLSSTSN